MTNNQNTQNNETQVTKVIIPCRISFANIWEPKSINGSEEKYSVSCIIPKSDKKTIAKIKAAVEAAKEQGKSKKWGGKLPPNLKLPLRDGDIDRPDRLFLRTQRRSRLQGSDNFPQSLAFRQQEGGILMQIALMNERITFQRNVILTDRIGNHMSSWNDEFSCYATVGGESGKETAVVGTTAENTDVTFTVRWCVLTATVSTTGYRIMFKNEIYDIIAIDHMNYKKKGIKFRCRKARR